jgi:hypothetical protein
MKRSVFVLLVMTGLLSGGFLLLEETGAGTPPDMVEEWVNDNLVRVRINGTWQDFPLMPLALNACTGGSDLVPGQ